MSRQGERPLIFSLRGPEEVPDWQDYLPIHQVPEGPDFAKLADQAAARLPREKRKALEQWRGRPDSLRLHQAVYVGTRLHEAGINHVHAHFAGMAARTAYWIPKFFDISYSFTGHANDIFVPAKFDVGLLQIVSAASATVAVSDFAANFLRQRFPEFGRRVHRIYNGINFAQFRPSQFAAPPLILSVGRLIDKKGFDILIEVCAWLREKEFRCEIIGEGPLRGELQARIERLGLQERVCLSGGKTSTEISDRMAEASIFALPARVDTAGGMDNLPTVIMEAMAASLPVVSTDVAGIPEMIEHERTGLIVPQNNAQSFAAAVSRLLDDPGVRVVLGRAGRARAERLFCLATNVAALREILHSKE